MNKITAKSKIYSALAIWLLVCLAMFSYGFKILDNSNQETQDKILQQNKELAVLEAEKASYEQANKDLSELSQKKMQPGDLFSRDITLVNELKTLESLAQTLGLDLNLSGISGTTKTAPKAQTQGDIVIVPYYMIVNGQFSKVVDFIETAENLPFITHLNGVTISAASGGTVNANLTANFYLRK